MLHRRYKGMGYGKTAWEETGEENRETEEGSSRKEGVKSTWTGDVDRDLNMEGQQHRAEGKTRNCDRRRQPVEGV